MISNSNCKIAFEDGVLTQYSSLEAYEAKEGTVLGYFDGIKQIGVFHMLSWSENILTSPSVASQTAFTALTSFGTVYTWGDARYESCLAREVSEKWYVTTSVS